MTKSKNIELLVRKNIRQLVPYSSARDEFSGTASVFLDANENPHNPPLNRYPDPHQNRLKSVVAKIKGQQPENLFLGCGSDEGIDLLFRVLCNPGLDNVVTVDPTYGMYRVCAAIHDVEVKSVLLNQDFSLDPEAVLKQVDGNTKMVFLCSPNNPTSNSYSREAMLKILDGVDCLVVLDEAYIDFSRGEGLLPLVPARQNLVVLQTLSKAWGLAGIRLGMVFAHETLVHYLSHVKYPYNINTLTSEKALEYLQEPGTRNDWVAEILKERKVLTDHLKRLTFVEAVFPSDANFLLVKVEDPGRIYEYLISKGIIVRDRSSVPLCEGCLRITVGTSMENQGLYEALRDFDSSKENQ